MVDRFLLFAQQQLKRLSSASVLISLRRVESRTHDSAGARQNRTSLKKMDDDLLPPGVERPLGPAVAEGPQGPPPRAPPRPAPTSYYHAPPPRYPVGPAYGAPQRGSYDANKHTSAIAA